MDSDVYTKIIQDFIALLEKGKQYAWFQQDGSTAHTSEEPMNVLASFFEDKSISKSRWSARSPDLMPPDFLVWAYVKNNVYRNKPSSVDELKPEIEVQIRSINENTNKHLFENS